MNGPSTAIELVGMFAETSVQVDVFSDQVIRSVKDGEVNPLKVQLHIKAMERAFERILKEIKDNVLAEADKYPGAEFDFMGNKIQKGSVSTVYDYAACKDEVWERFDADVKTATESRKEREAFLRALKQPMDIVDSNGEAVKLYPPLKKETPGIKITIR